MKNRDVLGTWSLSILVCHHRYAHVTGLRSDGVGYNPHKPGRPSHAYHVYWMGNLRLLLDVEVAAGDHLLQV